MGHTPMGEQAVKASCCTAAAVKARLLGKIELLWEQRGNHCCGSEGKV